MLTQQSNQKQWCKEEAIPLIGLDVAQDQRQVRDMPYCAGQSSVLLAWGNDNFDNSHKVDEQEG